MSADASNPPLEEAVGARIRALRTERGLSAKALATALEISPSAMSQIERGVLQPSVARLIAITDALDVPLTAVFDAAGGATPPESGEAGFALQRAGHAIARSLQNGVTFTRVSPGPTPGVEYFTTVYPPGASAGNNDDLFHHDGYEVGIVVSGELTIDFDDERVLMKPGDTIRYPCAKPHRLHNAGDEDVVAQWLIVHADR